MVERGAQELWGCSRTPGCRTGDVTRGTSRGLLRPEVTVRHLRHQTRRHMWCVAQSAVLHAEEQVAGGREVRLREHSLDLSMFASSLYRHLRDGPWGALLPSGL
ncbi:MAG: hypothetical protein QOE62_4092 [Actinomycetota bacterium]|jgi:hypothetical protein|nr:hypothetical protein [Actinomycetota bacterium]